MRLVCISSRLYSASRASITLFNTLLTTPGSQFWIHSSQVIRNLQGFINLLSTDEVENILEPTTATTSTTSTLVTLITITELLQSIDSDLIPVETAPITALDAPLKMNQEGLVIYQVVLNSEKRTHSMPEEHMCD